MGRLIFYIFCLITFSINSLVANDSIINIALKNTVSGNYKDFAVDNLGNCYLISSSNQIKKLNNNFDSVGVFNDTKRFGNISFLDVTNPLKILVFYKDFSTIIILDRFLNIKKIIDLRTKNYNQVKIIATSYDNNIWLFDEVENKLKKIDDYGNLIFESTDFRMLFDKVYSPQYLIDVNGKLFLYNSFNGLSIFDYYGALKNKFSLLNLNQIQIIDDQLIEINNFNFTIFDLKKLTSSKKSFKPSTISSSKHYIQKNFLYTLEKNSFQLYNIY